MKKKFGLFLIVLSFILTGFDYSTQVTVNVNDVKIRDIELSYNGKVRINEEINKEDFVVKPYYEWEDNGTIVVLEGTPLKPEEFTITPNIMTKEKEIVKVFYENVEKEIEIVALKSGRLTVKTEGLSAIFNIEDIKQEDDDLLLDTGKDITYVIKQEPNDNPIKEEIIKVINDNKKENETLEIIKCYDIKITKSVTGETNKDITEINNPISITLELLSTYIDKERTFWLAHDHNGITHLYKDLDSDANTVTFETGSFSDYVLFYTKQKDTEPSSSPLDKPTSTPTNKPSISVPTYKPNTDTSTQHIHNHEEIIKHATCEEQGYRKIICIICGSGEVREIEDALGHNWVVYTETQLQCLRCKKLKDIQIEQQSILGITQVIDKTDDSIVSEESTTDKDENNNVVSDENNYYIVEENSEVEIEEPIENNIEQPKGSWCCFIFSLLWLLLLIILIIILSEHRKRNKDEDKDKTYENEEIN